MPATLTPAGAAAADSAARRRAQQATPCQAAVPATFLLRDQVTTMDTNTAFGGCSATSAAGNGSGGPLHKEVSGSLPPDSVGPAALDCYSRRTRLPAGLSEDELLRGYAWSDAASTLALALVCALSISRAFGVWGAS